MPTSWSTLLSNGPESAQLNGNLRQVTDFIPHDIQEDAFRARLRNSTNMAYLALNSQRKVTILHHFKELGGTAAAPDVAVVCVVGLSARITVMQPNLANCFQTINTPAPNLPNMNGCNTIEALQALRPPARAAALQVKALIPIPPKLIPILATAQQQHNSDPLNILLHLKNSFATLDGNENDDAAKLSVHCAHILRFLWAKDTVQTIELLETTHPSADEFYEDCLRITQQQNNDNNMQEVERNNQQAEMNQNVYRIVEFLEGDRQRERAEAQEKENQSNFDSYRSKGWYLRAATTDGVTPATEPTVGMEKILDAKSATVATLEVRKILAMNYKTRFDVPGTMISKIRQGTFCGAFNQISGLTIFACFSQGLVDQSNTEEDELLALQSSEGAKELSKEAIAILANEKRKFVFPENIHTLIEGIIVFKALCSVIFGTESLIVKGLGSWTSHLENHRHHYNSLIMEKTLPTQIAANIDTNVAAFLRECEVKVVMAEVNKDFLKWDNSFNDLICNQFSYRLPPEIKHLMIEREPKSNKRKSTANYSQQQQPRRGPTPRTQLPMDASTFRVFLTAAQQYHESLDHLCLNKCLRHRCYNPRCNRSHNPPTSADREILDNFLVHVESHHAHELHQRPQQQRPPRPDNQSSSRPFQRR